MVSGATQANVSHASYSTPSGETSQPSNTSFVVAPTGDIFVVRGFSLGARLTYSHEHSTGLPDLNGLSIGPRIGYNFTLGEHFSFWPSVNAAYGETWYEPGRHGQGVSIGATAPLLYHPAPHFFLGFGPTVLANLRWTESGPQGSTDEPRLREYGAMLTVGGWVRP